MSGVLTGWNELILAFVLFLASHVIPARPIIRGWLIRWVGKAGYLWVYSLLSLFLFGWLIVAAGRAPYLAAWQFSPWQTWIPNIAMPFVCLLLAFGSAAPNPLSIGSRDDASFDPDHPGIAGVARHPLLWAGALWAFAHVVPNGDLAHVLVFSLSGAFSLVGMPAVDAQKQRALVPPNGAGYPRARPRSRSPRLRAGAGGRQSANSACPGWRRRSRFMADFSGCIRPSSAYRRFPRCSMPMTGAREKCGLPRGVIGAYSPGYCRRRAWPAGN